MDKIKSMGWIIIVISAAAILYALLFNPAAWIVYTISLVFIPLFILSLGFISMAQGRKEDEEAKTKEPFIGY